MIVCKKINEMKMSLNYFFTWQCSGEVEDTLIKLIDSIPVIEEHFYHLPPTHGL